MKLQKSPNRWSCLPTSFAMALNVSVDAVVVQLGHDGSEIVWPSQPEPYRRRGFHVQELILLSWHLGYSVTPFEACPVSQSRPDASPIEIVLVEPVAQRMSSVMRGCVGVVTGETRLGQAHAWDGESCCDPNGTTYGIENFRMMCFWAIKSR